MVHMQLHHTLPGFDNNEARIVAGWPSIIARPPANGFGAARCHYKGFGVFTVAQDTGNASPGTLKASRIGTEPEEHSA